MLPAILCIDIEPDGRAIDPDVPLDWAGFEAILPRIEEFREAASNGAPAHVSWFVRLDPQVAHVYGSAQWPLRRYRREIDRLRGAGDEIGLHVHTWRRERGAWIEDYVDSQWVGHCVELSFRAYREELGSGCRSFRFGDRWMDSATMRRIAKLGARYDLTVEPGPLAWGPPEPEIRWRFPDCSWAPREPYHPSRLDFRRRGKVGALPLWVLPITTAPGVERKPLERHSAGDFLRIAPSPALIEEPWDRAVVEVAWSVPGVELVEVRVDAPDGPLFCGGSSEGSARTGRWVAHGMQFFLLDAATGRTVAAASARLRLRRDPRSASDRWTASRRSPDALSEWIDLNLAYDPAEFRRALESRLRDPATRHLALVCRTDAALEEQAPNLKGNLEFLAQLARGKEIRFVAPEHAIRVVSDSGWS
jgi:hypothetical protein